MSVSEWSGAWFPWFEELAGRLTLENRAATIAAGGLAPQRAQDRRVRCNEQGAVVDSSRMFRHAPIF
jgi:hypothetical protein